jgi:hypothetical protein
MLLTDSYSCTFSAQFNLGSGPQNKLALAMAGDKLTASGIGLSQGSQGASETQPFRNEADRQHFIEGYTKDGLRAGIRTARRRHALGGKSRDDAFFAMLAGEDFRCEPDWRQDCAAGWLSLRSRYRLPPIGPKRRRPFRRIAGTAAGADQWCRMRERNGRPRGIDGNACRIVVNPAGGLFEP